MSEQTTDPGRERAWGDMMMPEEAARRQSQPDAPSRAQVDPPATPDPGLGEGTGAYTYGAASWQPAAGLVYARPPLGPGSEAMEGGASQAPRGYTGGAMGKFVAGLSPSFVAAARGTPPPGGDQFYTASEAATTFRRGSGIAHPTAQPSPDRTPAQSLTQAPDRPPAQRPNSLDVPTDSGTG